MFPELAKERGSLQEMSKDGFSRESNVGGRQLSQSVAVNKKSNLSEQVNVTNVQNVVQVDFIEADYDNKNQAGFKKRMPAGYNGSKANVKKKGGLGAGDGGDGNGDGSGDGNDGQAGGKVGGN